MNLRGYFSGRVIFDHRQKTAGQAINAWLNDQLGSGTVTANLAGSHQQAIRYFGGLYPIISGHMEFDGEGLDPRYQYMTLIREPVERTLSWITFLAHDVPPDPDTSELIEGSRRFIASNGRDATPRFLDSISNPDVCHFQSVAHRPMTPGEGPALAQALETIRQYDVVGLYEDLNAFLSECGALLGLSDYTSLAVVNSSSKRLSRTTASPELIQRIRELNALDLAFYEAVREMKARSALSPVPAPAAARAGYAKFEGGGAFKACAAAFELHGVHLRDGKVVDCGRTLTLELNYSVGRPLRALEAGILIRDKWGRDVFGTRVALSAPSRQGWRPGAYHATYFLKADLLEGEYVAVFSFYEIAESERVELAWDGGVTSFVVRRPRNLRTSGYVQLPVMVRAYPVKPGRAGAIGRVMRLCDRVGVRIGLRRLSV